VRVHTEGELKAPCPSKTETPSDNEPKCGRTPAEAIRSHVMTVSRIRSSWIVYSEELRGNYVQLRSLRLFLFNASELQCAQLFVGTLMLPTSAASRSEVDVFSCVCLFVCQFVCLSTR